MDREWLLSVTTSLHVVSGVITVVLMHGFNSRSRYYAELLSGLGRHSVRRNSGGGCGRTHTRLAGLVGILPRSSCLWTKRAKVWNIKYKFLTGLQKSRRQ